MNRFNTMGICALLALGIVWSTSCGPTEWGTRSVWGHGETVIFKMPKPFTNSDGWVELEEGRRAFEYGYVTKGDEEHKLQFRTLEMPVGAWDQLGINRHALLELALSRENQNSSDKILDRQDFTDPLWPANVTPAEELTIESADGKTVRDSRIIIYSGHQNYRRYVLLTAVRPKGEPRSPDVDKFFKSFKIKPDYPETPELETQDQ